MQMASILGLNHPNRLMRIQFEPAKPVAEALEAISTQPTGFNWYTIGGFLVLLIAAILLVIRGVVQRTRSQQTREGP